ncbi:MAG: hypothetical protein KAX42_00995 [Sphaerotilus sp.]|nr:hypothetical protein [Sphaerotilus sp.]
MFIARLVRLLLCTPLAALLRSAGAPWAWPAGDAGTVSAPRTVQSLRNLSRSRQRQRPLRRPRGREPPGVDPPDH